MTAPDRLTILRTKGLPATKTIAKGPDGRPAIVSSYGNAKRFAGRQVPIAGLSDLATALDRVRWDEFVIRGEPEAGIDLQDTVRRLHHDPVTGEAATFREVPRRWVLLDFDTVEVPAWLDPSVAEDAAAYLRSLLPDEFHASSFWWGWTSSAGIKPELRMRLAFWLERPVDKAFLDRWLADAPVDATVFRAVQAIYVAKPILRGVPDPVPRRSGLFVDVDDMVLVPNLRAVEPTQPAQPMHSAVGRRYVSGATGSVATARLRPLCMAGWCSRWRARVAWLRSSTPAWRRMQRSSRVGAMTFASAAHRWPLPVKPSSPFLAWSTRSSGSSRVGSAGCRIRAWSATAPPR